MPTYDAVGTNLNKLIIHTYVRISSTFPIENTTKLEFENWCTVPLVPTGIASIKGSRVTVVAKPTYWVLSTGTKLNPQYQVPEPNQQVPNYKRCWSQALSG